MISRHSIVGLGAVALVMGCSASRPRMRTAPPADFTSAAQVTHWELLSRPDMLHVLAGLVAAVETSHDACPQVRRDGALTVVTGDCVDASGTRHQGSARIVMHKGEARVRLRDFGRSDGPDMQIATGTVRVSTAGSPHFDIDLQMRAADLADLAPGSSWLAIDAEGGRGADGRWSMEGELAAETLGRVKARATGIQLDDERCQHEPLAGSTELRSGGHEVRIDYDGATDCDSPGTARWSYDGVAQGELEGIAGGLDCSVAPRPGRPWVTAVVLLGLVGLGRRRRGRSRGPAPRSIASDRRR